MSLYYHRLRKLEGYHFGVLCCAVVATVVLALNLILTIWAVSRTGIQDGLGTLYDGSCKRTATLTFWIHLAINVLSTLLLGASNYSMQCLSSPTRSEIDKMHGQGTWLDIGVPSVRNLRRLSTIRIVLWWLLAISSVPLHLLYNSAVFSTLCTRQYNVFFVSTEFLDGAPFNFTTSPGDGSWSLPYASIWTNRLQDYQKNQSSLTKLGNKACVEVYRAPTISTNSDVLLVTTHSNHTNSLLYYSLHHESSLLVPTDGICTWGFYGTTCNLSEVTSNPQNWSASIPHVTGHLFDSPLPTQMPLIETNIQYCLSKRVGEHCTLQFSLAIMIVVITCNMLKTICMSIIAWKQDPEPLVTLGDAIASFLDRPDVKTEGSCIAGKNQFEDSRSWGLLLSRWDLKQMRWFRAASRRRWLVCNLL